MTYLHELLGLDPTSPEVQRAEALVESSHALIDDLIQVRKNRGLSRVEVSILMGVPLSAVHDLESYDGDPTLSTIRLYAHAVGAVLSHTVEEQTKENH
jgi:predicted transcriptional regulator